MGIEVTWMAGSMDEARKVSRELVQEKAVAKAEITPWIESLTLLNGQLETAQETKVVLRTTEAHLKRIEEVVKKNSKYDIPEISWRRLEGVNAEFGEWMKANVKG